MAADTRDVSYFGTMMVHKEIADGMVSGAAHTMAHTIRPAFQFIGTPDVVLIVASVFIFPDLNTGNNTYKAVQRSSGAVAIGAGTTRAQKICQ